MSATRTDFTGALRALAAGQVVAAATESSFGLLADATRSDALDALLALKPRGSDKGVPLLLPTRDAWSALVQDVPALAARLAAAFWPGQLTIALPARPDVDRRLVLDGNVAVRLPGACTAAELARAFGRPLTATSANLPGEPAAMRDVDVAASFHEAIGAGRLVVIDGVAPGGPPSTVLIVRAGRIEFARVGAVPREAVEFALGDAFSPP